MRSTMNLGWLGAGLGVVVGAVLTGSLLAGSLEPTAPPAPTMRTQNELLPSWSRLLPAAVRFEVLTRVIIIEPGLPPTVAIEDWGVLDHETGLVWERRDLDRGFGMFPGLRGSSLVRRRTRGMGMRACSSLRGH